MKENIIKYSKFDSIKLKIQNINLLPNKFETPDQLFYYIENL